jgi:glycerol-1-phosphate dehydrogenase [NAD(P)+]
VICAAPAELNASGFADLLAKTTAGADWLLADALGTEAIDQTAWAIVQGGLREAVANPTGVRNRDREAVRQLTEGLMLGGFAMQSAKSSRPASGAEHQFSHLWDMQHHTHNGRAPSHGFKVGIGTLAVTALYERLLTKEVEKLDVECLCAAWPDEKAWAARARDWLGKGELAEGAARELHEKHSSSEQLRTQLRLLKAVWPKLREMLQDAGAPTEPEHIGITRARLRESYSRAFCIRRRFTVLDLAVRTGFLDTGLDEIFGPAGLWPTAAAGCTSAKGQP